MYSPVIDAICRDRGLSVAFLGIDQTPAIAPRSINPTFTTVAEAAEFDSLRKRKICEWRPAVVFVIDRWDIRVDPVEDFRASLTLFVREIAPCTNKIVFVAQVPVSRLGDSVNLREYASAYAHGDRLPRVALDPHEKRRRAAVEAAADVAKQFDKFLLLRPDERFYTADGSLKYADCSRFLYADDDHLTDQGAEYVGDLFESALPLPGGDARR